MEVLCMKSMNVIGKCSIEFPQDTPDKILKKIESVLKKEIGTFCVQNEPKKLHFEMSGYKKIDYRLLKKIQKEAVELLKKALGSAQGFNVSCIVYVESASKGYFFEIEKK
jgi:hypothetical protein